MKGRLLQKNEIALRTPGALPLIGKIKVGAPKGEKRSEYGDFFRATGSYASLFTQVYGPKPTKLEIIFCDNDIIRSCREELEGRGEKDGRRYGYSYDGQTFYLWDAQEQDYIPQQCEMEDDVIISFTKQFRVRWKRQIVLQFRLLQLRGVMGAWQFSTSGEKTSLPQIRNMFDLVLQEVGSVVNIPFDLTVKKASSQKPGDTTSYSIISLIPNISPENMGFLRNYFQQHDDAFRLGADILSDQKIQAITDGRDPETTPELEEDSRDFLIREGNLAAEKIQKLTNDPATLGRLRLWDEGKDALPQIRLQAAVAGLKQKLHEVKTEAK